MSAFGQRFRLTQGPACGRQAAISASMLYRPLWSRWTNLPAQEGAWGWGRAPAGGRAFAKTCYSAAGPVW